MKTYNSKIFLNFANFSCVIFLAPNVPIPSSHITYDDYRHELTSMVYKFFDKRSDSDAVTCADKSAIKSEIISNQQ